jgi:response regulator of citrate/malate metabolism
VLLDIYLPDMSGLEVLRRLRQELPDVDVLVASAARDVDTVKEALRGGVVHYLVKPFDQAGLRDRLTQYAEQHRRLHALDEARQEDLDRLFGGGHGGRGGRAQMPKGLTEQTADLVRQALAGAEKDLSATECAEATGLSRVAARRYLEFFVESGRAEVRLRYGSTGRPERRYRWAR